MSFLVPGSLHHLLYRNNELLDEIAGHSYRCNALVTMCCLPVLAVSQACYQNGFMKTCLAMRAEPSLRQELVFSKGTSSHVLLIFTESLLMHSFKNHQRM